MARGRIAFASSSLAVCAALALVVSAFTVRMYGGAPAGGGTLVAVNGAGVLVPVCVPLVLALLAFAGLHARCTRGSVAGGRAAVVVLALLTGFTLLGAASIGVLVLPIPALVGAAVALTPEP
jgi:hypothetical protein